MRKRRRNTRREPPPPRLDERLTELDLAALEKELQLLLETRASTPEMPAGEGLETLDAGADERAHGPPFRPHSVPEAEVVIIRRDRAAPGQQDAYALAQVPRAVAPPSSEPLRTPRAVFNGVVEEASVVIVRRPSRERTP